MPRHSKNSTALPFYTHHERRIADWGTRKVRLGAESLLPFATCYLCQHHAVEPHATPSGHMYCKECIFQYLLQKNMELKEQQKRYEEDQARLHHDSHEKEVEEQARKIQKFLDRETKSTSADVPSFRVNSAPAERGASGHTASNATAVSSSTSTNVGDSVSAVVPYDSRDSSAITTIPSVEQGNHVSDKERPPVKTSQIAIRREKEEKENEHIQKLQKRADLRDREEKVEEIKSSSFWIPEVTPEAAERRASKPDPRPRSPISGNFLRKKDLVPIRFVVDEEKQGGNQFEQGRYCCAVTKKEITNQKVVLIKPSGHVVLESVAKKVVYPDMRCPITGKKLRDKDILPLVPGGTSFAAHNEVKAESYRPRI